MYAFGNSFDNCVSNQTGNIETNLFYHFSPRDKCQTTTTMTDKAEKN